MGTVRVAIAVYARMNSSSLVSLPRASIRVRPGERLPSRHLLEVRVVIPGRYLGEHAFPQRWRCLLCGSARGRRFEPRDAQIRAEGRENLGRVRGLRRGGHVRGVELARVVRHGREVGGADPQVFVPTVQIVWVPRDQGERVVDGAVATSAARTRGTHGRVKPARLRARAALLRSARPVL